MAKQYGYVQEIGFSIAYQLAIMDVVQAYQPFHQIRHGLSAFLVPSKAFAKKLSQL